MATKFRQKISQNCTDFSSLQEIQEFFAWIIWLLVFWILTSFVTSLFDHPRSAIVGLSFVLSFGLDRIYSLGDIAIFIFQHFGLKLPIQGHFVGVWGIFPPNGATHRPNCQKTPSYVETCRLIHRAWKFLLRFDLGGWHDWEKKDRTEQDRTQKSHKVVIFRLFGEKPLLYQLKPKLA